MTDRIYADIGYTLRALKKYDAQVAKDVRKELRVVAGRVATEAKGNASWSSRIPGAIGVSVTGKGVGVRVSRRRAPHGALFERGSRGSRSRVRHPLFGNRNFWYEQPARPFIQPAVDAAQPRTVAEVERILKAAAQKVGL